ncbi:MAG: ABC transporter ATP-binding protein [Anaerolineales bacterium]|jgi:ABC-2 type transport system ATP-binding protein|nr:ABC transporter ATP-binding protein [Anaerolineales bacterium]MBM2847618.1 transporter ATP-binding protein [Anaerolineales bacterium]
MIETRGLTKRFGSFLAVDGVNLTVQPGEVLALLGPNGAGKTTTVRMLTSILKPTAGWARVAGHDVAKDPAGVRASVGVLTEHHGLYFRMRAEEYLDFFGELYGLPRAVRRDRATQLLEQFGMREAVGRRLGEYSKGMRQKLALIRALLHDPPVLLLDEPTSAMDPQSAKLVRDAIAQLRSEKRAIILCTHNLTEAELLADQIAVIRRGRIITQGSPAHLKLELLGRPELELRAAAPLNGLVEDLADLVEVVASGADWLRYRAADPVAVNPLILQRLAEQHVPVVTLAEVPRSLEDVYLRVVEADET